MQTLRAAGFAVESAGTGQVMVSRHGCAAVVANADPPEIVQRAGVMMGTEIGVLVDGGYQKFFQTPSGRKKAALAEELRAIHSFQEDLREGLGLVSLYNESLGTVSQKYLYDRVVDRDKGVPRRIWE